MESKKINLEKGYILLYDFGNIKVHNYNTADYIDDQVILLEKDNKIVIIESPAFYDNNKELEEYISSLNVEVDGILLSYHMAGGTFLDNTKKYATTKADEYGHNGGGKSLVDGFTKAGKPISFSMISTASSICIFFSLNSLSTYVYLSLHFFKYMYGACAIFALSKIIFV